MLTYPHIDPVMIAIGPLKIHWYGVMYLIGFASALLLARPRAQKMQVDWSTETLHDILFYGMLGVIIGGRIGYMLFYGWPQFAADPVSLFRIWEGGMAFHGGLVGVIVALFMFSAMKKINPGDVFDFLAPLVPIGLGAGRIGNFINGELWGRTTQLPWGMIFPDAGPLPRHPSQLYEFLLEGIVLSVILWWFIQKPRPRYAVTGLFLLFYGLFRFFIEFLREPDSQIGFIAFDWLTMGQLLSVPMILAGIVFLYYAYKKSTQAQVTVEPSPSTSIE